MIIFPNETRTYMSPFFDRNKFISDAITSHAHSWLHCELKFFFLKTLKVSLNEVYCGYMFVVVVDFFTCGYIVKVNCSSSSTFFFSCFNFWWGSVTQKIVLNLAKIIAAALGLIKAPIMRCLLEIISKPNA